MQSTVTALALVLSIQSPFAAAAKHSDEIIKACPNLKDGAVPTQVIATDLDFDTNNFNSFNFIDGQVTQENAIEIRNSLLFTKNEDAVDGAPNLIIINSPGGDTTASTIITDAMDITANTVTVCANNASSAALDILANGAQRYAMQSCTAIAHSIRGTIEAATPQEMIDYAHSLIEENNSNHEILTRKNIMSDTYYSALINGKNGDTTLDSHDLISLGLVDTVLLANYKMEVRTDDPRIDFQNCITKKSGGQELTDEQYSAIYTECEQQHMMP